MPFMIFQKKKQRKKEKLAWENSRLYTRSPLESPAKRRLSNERRNSILMTFTTQILVVLVIGWKKIPSRHNQSEALPRSGQCTSSVWNFCARYSDVVLQGPKWRPRETSAVFRLRKNRSCNSFVRVLQLMVLLLQHTMQTSSGKQTTKIYLAGFVKRWLLTIWWFSPQRRSNQVIMNPISLKGERKEESGGEKKDSSNSFFHICRRWRQKLIRCAPVQTPQPRSIVFRMQVDVYLPSSDEENKPYHGRNYNNRYQRKNHCHCRYFHWSWRGWMANDLSVVTCP